MTYQDQIGTTRNNQEIKRIREQEDKEYKIYLGRLLQQNGSIKILRKI